MNAFSKVLLLSFTTFSFLNAADAACTLSAEASKKFTSFTVGGCTPDNGSFCITAIDLSGVAIVDAQAAKACSADGSACVFEGKKFDLSFFVNSGNQVSFFYIKDHLTSTTLAKCE